MEEGFNEVEFGIGRGVKRTSIMNEPSIAS